MATREMNSQVSGNGYPALPPPIVGGALPLPMVGGDYMRDQALRKSAEEMKQMKDMMVLSQESIRTMESALLETNKQRQEEREMMRRGLYTLSPQPSEGIKQESRSTPAWEGRSVNIFTGQAPGQRTPQPPPGYRKIGVGLDGEPIYQQI